MARSFGLSPAGSLHDQLLPTYDHRQRFGIRIGAPREAVYRALHEVTFADLRLLRPLMATTRVLAVGAGILATGALVYARVIGPWQRRWGATDAEVARVMPGDELVPNPIEVTTRAVTVHAPPEDIWPWLVQMGNNRGGLYSYDWIDLLIHALDQPSVDRVLPELQHLAVGDVMPYAKGSDFVVRVADPNRALVIQLQDRANVVQSWGLYPVDDQHTRLVLRVRAAIRVTPRLIPALLMLDIAEGFMVRRQLLGIKQRAEARSRMLC